jgi:flavin-dependent dehydrogenase
MGIGVRRPVLHKLLAERAAELGVRMRWGTPVVLKEGQAAMLDGERCVYRWMVGADGAASRVRIWAGLNAGTVRSRRFGFRAHFRRAPRSEYVEIHWGEMGEAYVTPVGENEVGVAAMTHDASVRLAEIVESLPTLREKLAGAERTTTERGAATVTRRLRRVTSGNVALAGDASGSVDAITGEGLGLGFREALLLAESLEAGGLEMYEARHAGLLALPQRMAALMLLMDHFPALRRRALGAMAARPELFRELLAVHVGERTLARFVVRHGAEMGMLMASPRGRPGNAPHKLLSNFPFGFERTTAGSSFTTPELCPKEQSRSLGTPKSVRGPVHSE